MHNIDTPIREVFPPNKEWSYSSDGMPYVGYDELVESFGFEVVSRRDVGDYQGDSMYVLKEGSRYGWLNFGWGSCSGCDALQGCSSYEELDELRKSLHDDIRWFDSAGDLASWLFERLSGAVKGENYYWYGADEKEAVRELMDELSPEVGLAAGKLLSEGSAHD